MENKRRRVLVVDSSDDVRKMISETLDDAGYVVVEASNGVDALTAISRTPADMIISDLDIPGLDGLDLIQQIRSRKENRFVPIIMLTIEDTENLRIKGRAAGISGWLVKPFKPENVLSIVRLIS